MDRSRMKYTSLLQKNDFKHTLFLGYSNFTSNYYVFEHIISITIFGDECGTYIGTL